MSRAANRQRASTEEFDVCIIGGGITGAGILTQATERGWKTILIDKSDFASGTSSRSSKMIHGGLRYLKMFQLGLVREALHEREHLLNRYPGLVHPLPFIMASYHSYIDLQIKALGIRFYTKLAGASSLEKSKKISAEKVLEYLPGFRADGLKGGVLYWDGWTNDALLTIQALKEAEQQGAVVLNYCEAESAEMQQQSLQALRCRDNITGEQISVKAKVFINATGVWTDDVLKLINQDSEPVMKPSKGVHVVVSNKRLASDYVAIIPSANRDGRYLYSFPWEHDLTVLGATDTDYSGNKNEVIGTRQDVDYILQAFNRAFPQIQLTTKDIISVYSGLRPMLDEGKDKGSYSRSREYRIWWTGDNFLNIAGGKLTSFLSMGEHAVQTVEAKKWITGDQQKPICKLWRNKEEMIHQLIDENKHRSERLFPDFKTRCAEVIYHTRYLFAESVEDILTRRTAITYALKIFDEAGVRLTAQLMAEELKKPSDWVEEQVAAYRKHWKEYHPDFRNE